MKISLENAMHPLLNKIVNNEIVNANAKGIEFKKIAFTYRDGFLFADVSLDSSSFNDVDMSIPFVPVSDTEAVLPGLGRGKGETIRIVTENGEEHGAFSGFLLRKRTQ